MGGCVISANIMLLAGVGIKVLITIHLGFFKTSIDKKKCVLVTAMKALVEQLWYKRDGQ